MNTQTNKSGRARSRSRVRKTRSSAAATDIQTTTTTSPATAAGTTTTGATPDQDITATVRKKSAASPAPAKKGAPAAEPATRRAHGSEKPRTQTRRKPSSADRGQQPGTTGNGTFRTHPRGFGFVDLAANPAAGPAAYVPASCFVPPPLTAGLLAGDQVLVTYVVEDDGRGTATAITLADRSRTTVFGVVEAHPDGPSQGTFLRVDPHVATGKWRLSGDTIEGRKIAPGQAVLADIAGARSATPVAVHHDPASADAIRARILDRHQIAPDYPQAALDQATGRGRSSGPRIPRRDLRDLVTITIDADSSRDLDDALSVYPADPDGGVRVCVHIADVAAHVPAGSPVDLEARRTATSVYLPGWTRPMLPPALSEDALSLLPGLERDALTVEMRILPDGQVTGVDVYASRITSTMRLSYETAASVLAGARPESVPAEVIETLRWLRTAGARLGIQRTRRGGMDARRVEPDLSVAVVAGAATQVTSTQSNPAHQLIERLMVATNEAVDAWLRERGLPTLHRAHETPGPEVAVKLASFCTAAGYHAGFGETLTPLALAALSAQLEGADAQTAATVWDVLLANLGRAFYTRALIGHFGLASEGYLHFTSPIRRYADLCVHRNIHAYLASCRGAADYVGGAELDELAVHINDAAGIAARAEAQMRKALWMVTLAASPDTVRPGRVTGMNAKGVFVTLDESHVSGFLPIADLPGRGWTPTADGLALVSSTGRRVGFGDKVRARVAEANIESGQLELTAKARRTTRTGTRNESAAPPPSSRRSRNRRQAKAA